MNFRSKQLGWQNCTVIDPCSSDLDTDGDVDDAVLHFFAEDYVRREQVVSCTDSPGAKSSGILSVKLIYSKNGGTDGLSLSIVRKENKSRKGVTITESNLRMPDVPVAARGNNSRF